MNIDNDIGSIGLVLLAWVYPLGLQSEGTIFLRDHKVAAHLHEFMCMSL